YQRKSGRTRRNPRFSAPSSTTEQREESRSRTVRPLSQDQRNFANITSICKSVNRRNRLLPLPVHRRRWASGGLFDDLVGAGEDRRRTVRPSAFAVLSLTTSSNLVGCCTGSSASSRLNCRAVETLGQTGSVAD